MDFDDADSLIESRTSLLRQGRDRRAIAAGEARGIHRIGPGGFVDAEVWSTAWPAGRHLLAVAAYERRRRGDRPVYSHVTAAILHGLPLWGRAPERVHVSGPQHNGAVARGTPVVARHRCAVPDPDVVDLGRVCATGIERTLADVLRDASRATALVIADAALRRAAFDAEHRIYDSDAADALRTAVAERLHAGARGVRQARELLDLADGRAESPGESVSRLLLHDLGFARPRLQVRVDGPHGSAYFIDFGLDDAGVWGEYDGEVKYQDVAMRAGRTLDDVIRTEKEREDWIRGTTRQRVVRWTTADIRSPAAFRAKLHRFGVFPTPNHHRNAESPPADVHAGGDSAAGW